MINKSCKKWCHSDFGNVWSHLPCCLSKGPLKRDFLDIYLTTFFAVRIFANTSAMKVIFFLKLFEILAAFQKFRKRLRKSFLFFFYKGIWFGFINLSLLRRENLWSAINVFTNSPNIFHITKRDFSQLTCLHIDQ